MTHITRPRASERTLYRHGREYAQRRFGEQHADFILGAGRHIRYDHRVPVFGTPLETAEGEYHPRIGGSAGFASYDDLISALSLGRGQDLLFAKASFTTTANAPYSYWPAGGLPAAGAFGTALTGRTRSSTDVGALSYSNPTGGRTMHMVMASCGSTVNLGTLILYDRLAEYPFNGSVTAAQNFNGGTGVQIPARDNTGTNAGVGVVPFVENIQATTAATGPTLTLTYTNQAGTGGQSTGAVSLTGAALVNRILYNNTSGQVPWFPFQAGDSGIQNITAMNLSATITSTQLNVVLARVIGFLPNLNGNDMIERDWVLQLPGLTRIYDSSYLSFLLFANTTSCPVHGRVRICEN